MDHRKHPMEDPDATSAHPSRPAYRRQRPLRPAVRRLRPGAGPDRGRVGQGDLREVPGQHRPGVPHPRLIIKEQRAELVKHHLWVLWTDYFKPPHFEKYPQLHQLFNEATKLAGAGGAKGASTRPWPTSCCRRSTRSRRSSGRPSRRDLPGTDDPAGTSRGRAGRRRHGARAGGVRARPDSATSPRSSWPRRCSAGAPQLFGHVAVDDDDRPVGFALWFLNFSTWAGVHGIYLEDLYVARPPGAPVPAGCCWPPSPDLRGAGYRRLEWWMLDWNPAPASTPIGAEPMTSGSRTGSRRRAARPAVRHAVPRADRLTG